MLQVTRLTMAGTRAEQPLLHTHKARLSVKIYCEASHTILHAVTLQ